MEILVKEDGEDEWHLVSTFPRKDLGGDPATIRFGKIGAEWNPRDHTNPGSANPCRVEWVKAF